MDLEAPSSSRTYRRPLTIAVEGNIGSAKSTFLSYCQADDIFDAVYEPVDKWRNVNGVNLLENFYADPLRWGMTFQSYVNTTMLDQFLRYSFRPIKLMERSLWSARYCFQRCMMASGTLEPVMYDVLEHWHDTAERCWKAIPHAIVYIQTSPIVAHNRL